MLDLNLTSILKSAKLYHIFSSLVVQKRWKTLFLFTENVSLKQISFFQKFATNNSKITIISISKASTPSTMSICSNCILEFPLIIFKLWEVGCSHLNLFCIQTKKQLIISCEMYWAKKKVLSNCCGRKLSSCFYENLMWWRFKRLDK